LDVFYGIRTSGNDNIFRNNIFRNNSSVFKYGYYFGTTTIDNNNFINNAFVIKAPEQGYGYGVVSLSDNWWNTTDTNVIGNLINDKNDDVALQILNYLPIKTTEINGIGSSVILFGSITGTVKNNTTGEFIVGASISGSFGSATTDGFGKYLISNLSSAVYTLTINASKYISSTTNNVAVSIGAQTVLDISLVPKTTGTLTGQVLNSEGLTPISTVTIKVTKGTDSFTKVTDVNGNFSFSDLLAGDYVVELISTSYWSNQHSVKVNIDETTQLTITGIPQASAASSYYDTVQKIYIGYYQRPADPAGLIYWANDFLKYSLTDLIKPFASAPESQALYGTIDNNNIEIVINKIYNSLFGRDAEPGGLKYWADEFRAGIHTPATIMLAVLYGARDADLQSVNNKVIAANLFTRTIDPDLDGSNFQATYSGYGDNIAGRNFLTLCATSMKVPTQAETTAYIKANIANPGDGILTGDTTELQLCSGGTPTILFLLDARLRVSLGTGITESEEKSGSAELLTSINRFATDLCADGFRVLLAEVVPPTPPDIRNYFGDVWSRSGRSLVGAMLIGNIPYAYQTVVQHSSNPLYPDIREEAISFQYYTDVNGTFATSPASSGIHPYSYDLHTGDLDWELWIGVLPMYKGSLTATIDALVRYFEKNHQYRNGGPKPPRAFLQVSENYNAVTPAEHELFMSFMYDGTYAWTPFSNNPSAQIYFNSVSAGLTVQQGYTAMSTGTADFTVTDSHGWWGASGLLTIAFVESEPINTIFYWSNGCAVGDLDHADNFLTSIVYSPTSTVLVAKGTTNNSGGMGNNLDGFFGHNVATAMAAGSGFGSAIQSHVNTPLAWPWSLSREFHFGTSIIIGDPTLRLRP